MNRFAILLRKELRELMTLQMILPFVFVVMIFFFIGNIAGNETRKAAAPQWIAVLDQDRSPLSAELTGLLATQNFRIRSFHDQTLTKTLRQAKDEKIATVIVIPRGLDREIAAARQVPIPVYSIISNFSLLGSLGSQAAKGAVSTINDYLSDRLLAQKAARAPASNPASLKNPVTAKNYVLIGSRSAAITPDLVSGFITSQTAFLPIVMFIIIVIASQMIAVSIASEKENKTLETLLSTPISRVSLVTAKMVAAGIVSLLIAVFYMFGFQSYMNGVTGGFNSTAAHNPQLAAAIAQLGLTLDLPAYLLLGASLFLSILIALAISLILGAFAENVKSAQGLIAPITFLIMIPYFLTMFIDLNTAAPLLRFIVYAIPFSHPFLAGPFLFLHNYPAVVYGLVYQAVFFIILVIVAARIFASDRVLTMKLNFKKGRFQIRQD